MRICVIEDIVEYYGNNLKNPTSGDDTTLKNPINTGVTTLGTQIY